MGTKQILQQFEGTIDSVDHDKKTFWATLYDITNPQPDLEEMAEFEFSSFAVTDHPYIKEGYIFDWILGDIINEHNIVESSFSELSFLKRTRKEQALWRKEMRKVKKESKRMSEVIQKLFD